ncbi:hypothetical protein G7Z17_g2189 [Cylindrodendrum hubeiense]|uniref:Conserved oligomeric Golgi complex subunit 4 n=1 Tax=Cylindrodendrum hubeiense TaxID=595255 RepID=A0A9P5HEP0_9HYPO|nr:hypothetical protein G7Z17_g2189 [Cylindrodendrum hubeiense]
MALLRSLRVETSPATTTATADLRNASTLDEIRTALSTLHAQETSLNQSLNALLASQADLARQLKQLDSLRAELGQEAIATRSITNDMLSTAASTAGPLRDKVQELDLEKTRVDETLVVVEQVAELKACVHGVVGSMGAPQDWEAAAGYVSRAAKISDHIVRGSFSAAVVPSVEVPDSPWITLEHSKESLCQLFLREFESAASQEDHVKVTKFFKLFPLIGRQTVGLDVYGRYVCQGVAKTARETLKNAPAGKADGFFYTNALIKLLKHVMQIIDQHGTLVERHYGAGNMVKVIERLQMEADVQGGIILDSWSEARGVEKALMDAKSYPFTFLLQSFPPPTRRVTPRVSSPATGAGARDGPNHEDEVVSITEVDSLLSDVSTMLRWWSLYTQFIAEKCKGQKIAEDDASPIPNVVLKSHLSRKVAEKLTTPYHLLMVFFFRRSIEKAFQLNEYPNGLSLTLNKPIDSSPPFIITAIDDITFVLNAIIQKTVSTAEKNLSVAIIATLGQVLSSHFIAVVKQKLRDDFYPKPVVQGGFPPEDKIIAFIALINSLDMASEYLDCIISNNLGFDSDGPHVTSRGSRLHDTFLSMGDSDSVAASLVDLVSSFTSQTTELLNNGVQVLFIQVVKPRLHNVLIQTFRDVNYMEGDDRAEADPTPEKFERGWDQLMRPISRIMSPRSYAVLLDLATRHLAHVLEKRVWGYTGRMSALGAIRIERDFSGIISVVSRGDYSLRDLFSRVSQVLMVVNMEEDEWEELSVLTGHGRPGKGSDGIPMVLTGEERTRARALTTA